MKLRTLSEEELVRLPQEGKEFKEPLVICCTSEELLGRCKFETKSSGRKLEARRLFFSFCMLSSIVSLNELFMGLLLAGVFGTAVEFLNDAADVLDVIFVELTIVLKALADKDLISWEVGLLHFSVCCNKRHRVLAVRSINLLRVSNDWIKDWVSLVLSSVLEFRVCRLFFFFGLDGRTGVGSIPMMISFGKVEHDAGRSIC